MNSFSISQLAQYSGIKPHTIRIWEQRYNALKPERSEGNTRYYDNDQLRRLLNIVSLMDSDYKVSELCSMTDDKLFSLVSEPDRKADIFDYYVSQLIAAGMSYDEKYFDDLFQQCLSKFQIKDTYKNVIYPLLDRVGLMWSKNKMPSAQEHFISNIIRKKLLYSIASLPAVQSPSQTWILFLPEDEFHEIGLLFADVLIRQAGHKVIYLGSSVSAESVLEVAKELSPSYLLLFMVHYEMPGKPEELLNQLEKGFTGKKICLAGNHKLISEMKLSEKIYWLRDIETLENIIKPVLN